MSVGINNVTAINMTTINQIANFSDPVGFFVNVNNDIFAGILYFTLLWILWGILWFALQDTNDDPMRNAMSSGAIITILSLILRVIEVTRADSVIQGLLSDSFMWIFPIITILLTMIVFGGKRIGY